LVLALVMLAPAIAFSTGAHAQAAPAPATGTPADTSTPVTTPAEAGPKLPQNAQPPPQGALPVVGVNVTGGPGFAISGDGRSRLHLGVDAGAGLDTNPYSVPLAQQAFAGDLVARVRPHLDLDAPGSLLAFQASGLVDYGVLPGLLDPKTQSFLLYQTLLLANLEVNRGGTFGLALGNIFSWDSDPGAVSLGTLFNRITDNLQAGVVVRPGGGALEFRVTYGFVVAKYFDPANLTASGVVSGNQPFIDSGALDNMTNSLNLRVDYKFLPKTGFFGQASAGINTYFINITNPNSPNVANGDSYPVSAIIGMQGQLLSKVAGLISVGYSNPLVFDHAVNNNGTLNLTSPKTLQTAGIIGIVGQAEVQWIPSPVTRLGLGFQRSYAPAPLYQYLGNNRFYANATQMIGGRFLVTANAGYSLLELGRENAQLTQFAGKTGRFDQHVDALANVSYFFTDWMSLGVTDRFDWQITNAVDASTVGVAGTPQLNLSYIRNQTVVLASVFY
jgi:hypothetical protein